MPRDSASNNSQPQQKLRIIAGQWRSRRLSFPSIDGLRPTSDRTRETLFNWLADLVHQAWVLDLFAGSGALGLEALSRGAKQAVFIEQHSLAAQQLTNNCRLLEAQNAQVIKQDAILFLRDNTYKGFDIVFIDPPFAANAWQDCFDLLEQKAWLNDKAFIYVETPTQHSLSPPKSWHLIKQKSGRNVDFRLYQRELPQP